MDCSSLPQDSNRVSVIHSRASVICKSKFEVQSNKFQRADRYMPLPGQYRVKDGADFSQSQHHQYDRRLIERERSHPNEFQMRNQEWAAQYQDYTPYPDMQRFQQSVDFSSDSEGNPTPPLPTDMGHGPYPYYHPQSIQPVQPKLLNHFSQKKRPYPDQTQLQGVKDRFSREDKNISQTSESFNRQSYHTTHLQEHPTVKQDAKRMDDNDSCWKENFPSKGSPSDSQPVSPKKPKLEMSPTGPVKEKTGGPKPTSNCHVCGDLAVAHMHYGGVCCYSCKAFFRRATQTGKDAKYKCKSGQNCSINYTNRRACQYCRFHKCVQVGMKPNWVLSEEQCNIRFRKDRKDASPNKDKMAREGTGQEMEEIVKIKEEDISSVDNGLTMPFTNEETRSLEYYVDNYTQSKETFTFSEENNMLWKLLFNNNKPEQKKHEYSTFDLGSLIMTVIKKNIFYVQSNSKFDKLSKSDQNILLQKNMSEMCHIRGAIRFDTKSKNFVWYFSKKDQLNMAFQKKDSIGGSGNTNVHNALIGHKDMSKFYQEKTSQTIFALVNKLCELELPMEVLLIIINIILFSSDGIQLENKKMVEDSQTNYMLFMYRYLIQLFGNHAARMKLSKIMANLIDLRELCERSKEEELRRIQLGNSQQNHLG